MRNAMTAGRAMRRPVVADGLSRLMSTGGGLFVVISAILLMPILLVGIASNNDGLIYIALSFTGGLIPLMAGLLIRKQFDIFEPINLAALAIFFGSAIRSVYLLTSSSDQVDFLMMGTDFEAVADNLPLILFSVISMTMGYVLFPQRFKIERLSFFKYYRPSRGQFYFALWLSIALSIIGIYLSMDQYGIKLDKGLLAASSKRVAEITDEAGNTIYGVGVSRFIADLASHGFVMLACAFVARLLKPTTATLILLGILFVVASLMPFLSSSRSNIILMFMTVVIVMSYYGRLSMRAIVIALVLTLTIVTVLGNLREQNQRGEVSDQTTIDLFVGSGHGVDFVRTSAIMDRVPRVVPYQYGHTYLGVFSFLPRSMWPTKPDISLGAFVKGEIFGQWVRVNGWPPGILAEGWINFGPFGLILPMVLLGMYLRAVYETVRPHLGVSYPITVLWGTICWGFSFNTMNLNFAQGFWQAVNSGLPLIFFLAVARKFGSGRAA